jgi:ABC-2 type transport system permease protein
VLVASTIAVTGSWPREWWPLGPALIGGTALAVAFAFVTAAFTATPELAQVTTLPVFLALFGGGFWVGVTDPGDVTWAMVAVPGGSVAQLIRLGWDGAGITWATVLPPLVVMAVTVAALAWLAGRVFRWQPRS